MRQSKQLTLWTLFSLIFLVGCEQPVPDGNVAVTANANAQIAQPAEPDPDYSNVLVTVPLIDAMMNDQQFRQRAQDELQLTDEELTKLWDATRDLVLNPETERPEADIGSTAASTRLAEEKVGEALGAQKGDRFLEMVRREVGGQNPNALATAQPNSVPSDTRVVVNAPAYRMDVFENGELRKSYKIGIGYPEFPLPVGLRRAKELQFNPTWTPPDEPWVKGNVQPGRTVEAGSKLNPLGIVKIPIGLPSLIHGGKSANRLGTFNSHGCVGLTDDQARNLSLLLASISGAELTEQDVEGFRKNRSETKVISLDRDVPVELRYETIVVEDGRLHIHRDVYERGTNTEDNLRRVLQAFDVSFDNLQPEIREGIIAGLRRMAVDAQGDPVEQPSNSNANNQNSSNTNSAKVTRDVKGAKLVTFELAELRGKGYPAPVDAKF